MTHQLFVYGTLAIPEVLSAVIGHDYQADDYIPASLHGYRRHAVAGVLFPVIRQNPSAWVDGYLVQGLSDEDMARLDQWEQGYHERIAVKITTEEGSDHTAWVYADTQNRAPILEQDWDVDAFRNSAKIQS